MLDFCFMAASGTSPDGMMLELAALQIDTEEFAA